MCDHPSDMADTVPMDEGLEGEYPPWKLPTPNATYTNPDIRVSLEWSVKIQDSNIMHMRQREQPATFHPRLNQHLEIILKLHT